jgi:hypothetical protein
MNPDLALVIGLLVLIFSAPAMISAIADRRAPRVAMIMLVLGGGLVLYALTQKPGGYRLEDVPRAFIQVIADVI